MELNPQSLITAGIGAVGTIIVIIGQINKPLRTQAQHGERLKNCEKRLARLEEHEDRIVHTIE